MILINERLGPHMTRWGA